jgi:hypothetical protein
MPIRPPATVPYQSPVTTVPAFTMREPNEGPRMVHCEIDWGTMGGPNYAVAIDVSQNRPQNFTQIISINADNTNCGVDVVFYFPDTMSELTIPAFEQGNFPVFTGQTHFIVYVKNQVAGVSDITIFDVLNFLPPPVAIPRADITSVGASSVSGNIALAGTGLTTGVFAAPAEGIITGINVSVSANIATALAAGAFVYLTITNNAGTVGLWAGAVALGPVGASTVQVASINGVNIPYSGGPPKYTYQCTVAMNTGGNVVIANFNIVVE